MNDPQDLIRKMLSGDTLTAREQQQLQEMMEAPGFQEMVDAVLDEQGGPLDMPNSDAAFTAAKLEAFHQLVQPATPVVRMFRWKRALPYAAAVAIAAGSFLYWQSGTHRQHSDVAQQIKNSVQSSPLVATIQYTERYNASKHRLKVKLPDGSSVTLGSNSRLKYPAGFAGATRDVYLEGEAFFDVTKQPEKPFTVYTGPVHTLVLGTSFKVSALPHAPVEVAVVTGKVKVTYHQGNTANDLATMLPGEKISWNNNQLAKLKFNTSEVLVWKNEQLAFKNQPLKNILDAFQEHYNVHITVINKGFLTERISLTLDEKMPLEKAMNVLAGTAGFEHSIDSLSGAVIIK